MRIENYKSLWRESTERPRTSAEIEVYIGRRSRSISAELRRLVTRDTAFKLIASIACLVIAWICRDQASAAITAAALSVAALVMAGVEWRARRRFDAMDITAVDLRRSIVSRLDFMTRVLPWISTLISMTSPLVVTAFMIAYFRVEYGRFELSRLNHAIVIPLIVAVSWAVSLAAHLSRFRAYIQMLVACLTKLDEATWSELQLRVRRARRIYWAMILLTAVIAFVGVVVFYADGG